MKILIDIGHPAHVHLFKNVILKLKNDGHEIRITARKKEIALNLLDSYGFDYTVISTAGSGFLGMGKELLTRDYQIFKIARKFKPDIMLAVLDPSIAHVGKVLGIPTITFTDSEPEAIKYKIADKLTLPFTDVILTLESVRHDYGKKEVKINSYKELAYLHQNYFKPNPNIIRKLGLTQNDDFIILRFVSFGAYHDVGRRGFDLITKLKLVHVLEKYAKVFISSEEPLPKEFEKYKLTVGPENIHNLLYFAKMLICDSQTMTTEAAILGTPVIRYNSFVGVNDMGNFIELEKKYGLIFNYNDTDQAINKAIELIKNPNLKVEWKTKREILLGEKIDLTAFLIWFIENYPNSVTMIKNNRDVKDGLY